ncbi:MAG: amino acid permease [Burkholderiales bacterium]
MDGNKSAVTAAGPRPLLSVGDGIFLTVGMVVGVGIFKLPSLVAGNASSPAMFMLLWVAGGVVSLCGALVYAELAARHAETGGEYVFLQRGLGSGAAFLFAWSRMSVIQTGAIAAVAFAFGEYATQILALGKHSTALWAAIAVAALTGLNLAGTWQSKTAQKLTQIVLIAALVVLALLAFSANPPPRASAPSAPAGNAFGLAMIFVLFTFGGWNEAAYLSGELREARRNMVRVLVWGILAVTALYLLVNAAYLSALGLQGMRGSSAVAADAMRLAVGDGGAVAVAVIVCASALTTMNAAIFTGARTNWALGRDYRLFSGLGAWRETGSTPANSLLLQGAVALALIGAGSATPDGFGAMVAYTAPVFWTFFLLTGATLFVFRSRGGEAPAFRVPLYPVVPIAFLAMCAFMLWSAVDYIRNPDYGPRFGAMVLAGILVMALGIPLYFFARRK